MHPSSSHGTSDQDRPGLLSSLSGALEGLGRKLASQRDRLREAAALAPRAEEAALRARLLALGCGDGDSAAAGGLAAEIGELAAQAGALALQAERAAGMNDGAIAALVRHAAALAALAGGAPREGETGGLKRILGPLVGTLARLPAQRQAEGAIGAGLSRLAGQARPLADRAGRITGSPDAPASAEAQRLARDLGALAAAAEGIAAAIEREAGPGGTATERMMSELRSFAATAAEAAATPIETLPPIAPAAPPRRSFGKAPVWQGVSRIG